MASLVDINALFITDGVVIGNVVLNTTTGASATVTAVVSETELTLSSDIFAPGDDYSISRGVQTSFLLDYCFQFMQFRSMVELNFMLKEDQRVQISAAALTDAWNNVVQWNATVIGDNVDDANLD